MARGPVRASGTVSHAVSAGTVDDSECMSSLTTCTPPPQNVGHIPRTLRLHALTLLLDDPRLTGDIEHTVNSTYIQAVHRTDVQTSRKNSAAQPLHRPHSTRHCSAHSSYKFGQRTRDQVLGGVRGTVRVLSEAGDRLPRAPRTLSGAGTNWLPSGDP